MTPEELKATLQDIKDKMHAEFNGNGAVDRLQQFDAHMSTVMMVIDCLFEESTRMEGYRA